MKRKFIIVCSIIIVVVFVGVFTGCTALKAHSFSDDRIHRIDFVASALENTGFELSSFSENTDGFVMCGNSKFSKSQLTGIQYVGGEDAEIDVTYNSVYTQSENAVRLSAESKEVNYNETITFQPDTSVQGKFDGTIFINGQEFNVFELENEDEDIMEECALFTGILIGGIALWKIIAGVTVATVAFTMTVYPEFYVKGLERIAKGLETAGKVVIGGMTFMLTQATAKVISQVKSNTDSRKYDKYYPTILVNEKNISEYDHASVGDTLISKYPVKRAQAVKNFRSGIHNYTTYASDAKSVIGSAWLFDRIYKDPAHGPGQFRHYHSSVGYAMGYHMHSFYGAAA